MLPHLQERPLNMQRFPNGPNAPGFWQKDIPGTAPAWLRRWKEVGVEEREANEHLVADRVGALCWLGNQTSFEIHAWTSRIDDPMTPTFALIDIDPGTKTTWDETLQLARLYRTALEHLGVRGYPKTTGKRGIQVWIPIVPKYSFRETSDWVEALSRAIGGTVPELVSWEWAKASRGEPSLKTEWFCANSGRWNLVTPQNNRGYCWPMRTIRIIFSTDFINTESAIFINLIPKTPAWRFAHIQFCHLVQ
jgi:bifunctional non-homologous end joining protein LigD